MASRQGCIRVVSGFYQIFRGLLWVVRGFMGCCKLISQQLIVEGSLQFESKLGSEVVVLVVVYTCSTPCSMRYPEGPYMVHHGIRP